MDQKELMQLLEEAQNAPVSYVDLKMATQRIKVDMDTRKITGYTEFGVIKDHLAENITFEVKRYKGDTDLAEKHCAIHWENGKNGGVVPVTEIDLSEDGLILMRWELSDEFTQYAGSIAYALHFFSILDGGFTYHAATNAAVGTLGTTLNASAHSKNKITPSEIEVYIAKMNELSAAMDAQIVLAQEAATKAESIAEQLAEKIAKVEELTQKTEINKNDISKLSGDIVDVKSDIGELQGSIYNTHKEYVEVTNGIVMLSGYSITKISSTKFTVESSSTNNIKGCKVKEGENIKITCYTFNEYTGFGYVWGSTEQTPEKYNGSNALQMLSSDTYDYFCGNTERVWKTYEMELTVPAGAKMIWVRTENSYPIYKFTKINESKIPTKTSQLENDSGFLTEKNSFVINNIFSLPVPTVSVGTLENQMLHTLHNESVPLWKFQEVGTIDFGEVSIQHNSNDTVGLWIYCNEAMLSYSANTDGTMELIVNGVKIDTIYVAYKLRVGWNYFPIKVTENKFNLKIAFTLVRGNYEFAVDSIELNHVPKVKPKVLFSFDMGSETMYTNRHLLLKEYGFRATYCNIWGVSEINRNKMLAYGDDWAIYGNDSTSSTVYPGDNATVEEFEEYLQKTIDRAESIGLFNPVSYFSPNNAGLQNLMQALKNKGYRIGRTAVSGQYAIDYFGKDSFYINTYGVGGSETSVNVLKAVDDAINAGNSICIFTHDILESPSDNINAKKSTYVEILDGIKERVNAGKCEVCTFTDFYREWMPNDCASYLENRHEKEKQYIIGKLSS